MKGDACPRCGDTDMVGLVDPKDETWGLNPEEFEEDAEVWHCSACNWYEEAEFEDALDYHTANLEWAMGKIAEFQKAKEG